MIVEDIILSKDKKGVSKLKKYLDKNFCEKATKFILQNCKKTIITTGFYVNGTCETDGLVGAVNLANVLYDLGTEIVFITDKFCSRILQGIQKFQVIEIPLGKINSAYFDNIIEKIKPSLIISIERLGRSFDDKYYNFKGQEISDFTGKIDILFEKIENSVAVGDTGNEIGMGNLYEEIIRENIYQKPSIVKSKHLVLSSISNWGCYGIITYISNITKKDYLGKIEDLNILKKLNSLGVIDGITKKAELTVDEIDYRETKKLISKLKVLTICPKDYGTPK